MKLLLLFALLLVSLSTSAQTIVGQWKTIDDTSGEVRSIVEIYESNNKYYGKVVEIFSKANEDQDPSCDDCSGERKGKKVIGLEIISDMELNSRNQQYHKGTILDPENGKVYDCKIWVEDGNLKVRGYVAFFYRTQTWLPVTNN